MSILAVDAPIFLFASLFILAVAISVVIIDRLGVFRAETIQGPVRLAPNESALLLMFLVLAALFMSSLIAAVAHRMLNLSGETELIVINGVFYAAMFPVLIYLNVISRRGAIRRLGVGAKSIPNGIKWGAAAVLLLLPLLYFTGFVVTTFLNLLHLKEPQPHPLLQYLKEKPNRNVMAIVFLSAGVLAPLAEELLFRAHLQTALVRFLEWTRRTKNPDTAEHPQATEPDSPPPVIEYEPQLEEVSPAPAVRWIAVVITSFIFAAVHGEPAFVLPLFVLALGLGYSYERTGNLWIPIFTHALFNTTQVLVFLATGQ
jgi:membrane protease YdiL (CAAX protease family)